MRRAGVKNAGGVVKNPGHMTRAVRSPGSTLKPFIYGLAFEDGFVHPESLIDDRPIRFGSYAPENFDMLIVKNRGRGSRTLDR